MYQNFFGMTRRPFGLTLQPDCYFTAAGQEEAVATLRYAITQGRGIGMLTGAPGTGKTMVCHRLAATVEPTFGIAMITNTNLGTTKALLQAIHYDLALPYHGMDEQELRLTLSDFLIGKYAAGSRTVLIVDEAQNLTAPLLEEVRMLGNLEGEAGNLLQVVLAGQPRLVEMLRKPELEAINQRIGARATIAALTEQETAAFVKHQLEHSGIAPDKIFSEQAIAAVYEATLGVPRLINRLCDHSLLLAYVGNIRRVDAGVVEQAMEDLERQPGQVSNEPQLPGKRTTEIASEIVRRTVAQSPRRNAARDDAPVTAKAAPTRAEPAAAAKIEQPARAAAAAGSPAQVEMVNERPVRGHHPLDEIFEQEELIVDQYAAMDAKKPTTRLPARTPRPVPARALPPTGIELVLPRASEPAQRRAPVAGRSEAIPAANLPTDSVVMASPTPFLEPGDGTASYEVGATAAEPTIARESDILIIENRSKRVGGNRGRVDGPQRPLSHGPGAYRRLFTQARRS